MSLFSCSLVYISPSIPHSFSVCVFLQVCNVCVCSSRCVSCGAGGAVSEDMGCTSAKQLSAAPPEDDDRGKNYSNGDLFTGQYTHTHTHTRSVTEYECVRKCVCGERI